MTAAALLLAALAAGAALAAQGPLLARVAAWTGGPLQAAIVAFTIGLGALVLAAAATGALPRPAALARMPAWLGLFGLIGTALLLLTLHAVPRLGVAPFAAAVLTGQLVAALAYDHFGALGMPVRPVGAAQLAGAALLLAGLALILRAR